MKHLIFLSIIVCICSSVGYGQDQFKFESSTSGGITETFAGFTGSGFAPGSVDPTILNSNRWVAGGFSESSGVIDGSLAYGETDLPPGSPMNPYGDFHRGGTTELNSFNTAGIFGADVGDGDSALVVRTGDVDWGSPLGGHVEVRIQNTSGADINTEIDIAYGLYFRDDSTSNTSFISSWYTTTTGLANTTQGLVGTTIASHNTNDVDGASNGTGWIPVDSSITRGAITPGLANGDWLHIRFSGIDGGGGSNRDEIGLGSLSATIPEPTTYALIFGVIALIGVAVKKRYSKSQ